MKAAVVIGQSRPSVLSILESIVKNCKVWLHAKSETFTALCGDDGEVFTHLDVVKAHVVMVAIMIIIGIGGALW